MIQDSCHMGMEYINLLMQNHVLFEPFHLFQIQNTLYHHCHLVLQKVLTFY